MVGLRFALFLFAVPSILAFPLKADALLTYTISQQGSDVLVQASGSVDLTDAQTDGFTINCGIAGSLIASDGAICTGNKGLQKFNISGPTSLQSNYVLFDALSYGTEIYLYASRGLFAIDRAVASGPINATITFSNQTLAGLGLTPGSTLGEWFFDRGPTASLNGQPDITVVVAASVPAPLPVVGAAAA